MEGPRHPSPERLLVRLGEDLNWWIEHTGDVDDPQASRHGVLDPRQVAHLTETLDAYRRYGFRPETLTAAFQMYVLDAELDEGRLRLRRVGESIYNTSEALFALPLFDDEGSGPYSQLLDTLSSARVRLLNHTHRYARKCTEEEMNEELNALDDGRYFSAEAVHAFDEIHEIFEWKPAEWDDPEA